MEEKSRLANSFFGDVYALWRSIPARCARAPSSEVVKWGVAKKMIPRVAAR